MEKRIITPEECGNLIPHWPELDRDKLRPLERLFPRTLKLKGNRYEVMSTPGIILQAYDPKLEGHYIVNGKHRAFQAYKLLMHHNRRFNVEAFIVNGIYDLKDHVPNKAYGQTGIEGCIDSLVKKRTYVGHCHSKGIYRIKDFCKHPEMFR